MKVKDLRKMNEEKVKKIQKAIDRRAEFIKRMKEDPDFKKYFLVEIKKELKALDSLSTLSEEISKSGQKIEDAMKLRHEKIKLLKKIFGPFLT